ncbi:SIS domain-containing protein [Clostridioides difficile]|uniref:SIS domain-containing protein n=1 Tax=Clostridioides difficile TaxID=1496 RepID=UPI002FE6C811
MYERIISKSDLFIIISLSGETKAGIEIAKFINNHIHTISLTRLDNNTIATLCEYNLYVETQNLIHYKLYLMKS